MATHRRIRPFNTRETYPEQNLDNDLCQAVVAGNTVYLRGQIGQDLETRESVGIGDVGAQTERAMGTSQCSSRNPDRHRGHRQDRRLSHRYPLPGGGLSGDGSLA